MERFFNAPKKTLFMKNLHIPNPCSEKWESMSPQKKGRFCSVCDKCVIDFTEKKPQEIIDILNEKTNEKICGRFLNHQVQNENSKFLNLKKQFSKYIPTHFRNNGIALAIFSFIVFLTGCSKPKTEEFTTTGLIMIEEDSIPKNDDYIIGEALIEDDSVYHELKKDSIVK